MSISHLVRRDSIHERQERPALVAVAGQRREHRETHLLRYVVRRSERLLLSSDPGTAVPHHERTNPAENSVHGITITVNGGTHQDVEVVPY